MVQEGGLAAVLVIASLTLVAGWVTVPLARRAALRLGVVDQPIPGHKSHSAPVPYLGGAAIAAAALAGAGLSDRWGVLAFILPALGAAAIGLVDDLITASPAARLSVEAAAAGLAWWLTPLHQRHPGLLGLTAVVVCLTLAANCFNLIDNTDGCAGAVGLAMAGGLAGMALVLGEEVPALVGAAVVGGLVAFLSWNWHPARIFMGDAGSLFLGFLLAEVLLSLRLPVDRSADAVTLLLVMAPVLFDTTLVVISRLAAGRSILIGGCDHTAHRLRRLGLGVPAVAVLLGAVSLACAGMALAVAHGTVSPLPAAASAAIATAGFLFEFLRVPVYDAVPAAGADPVLRALDEAAPVPRYEPAG